MTKKLSLTDCVMIIMGSMIGSGIFIVPATMSAELKSPTMLLFAWLFTALITIFAALSYGELAAIMPKAGGQYVYLKEAYSPMFGFLYGWTFFLVIQTGTIAAVAVAFANYTGVFSTFISDQNVLINLGVFHISSKQILAVLVVWLLTFSNFRSIKTGAAIQNIFTVTKIGALVFMIVSGIYFIFNTSPVMLNWSLPQDVFSVNYLGAFCGALVGSIFSSDAWNNVTFTGSEIENPKRNLALSLLLGTTSVLILYVFINYIYLYAIPFNEIVHAENNRIGSLLLFKIFGNTGMFIMAALIMISTFGCLNGLTLSGARVYYAMSIDGLFFKKAQQLNKANSPQTALIIQAIWTSLLTFSGSYGDLLDYVVIAVLLFYILTVLAVFKLRFSNPNLPRPYKVWGYPIVPAAYVLFATTICVFLMAYKPAQTLPGIAIVIVGIPVYYWLNKQIAKT